MSIREIDAVLFDMDGTLLDSAIIWFHLLNGATQEYGFPPVSMEVLSKFFGQPMNDNVTQFLPGLEFDVWHKYCDTHYIDHLHHMEMLEGSVEVARVARDSSKGCYIVTNCPRLYTELLLHSPIADELRQVFTNEDGSLNLVCAEDLIGDGSQVAAKPDGQMLHIAANKLGVDPSRCMMVGDSIFDVKAGQSVGAFTVGINKSADLTIQHIKEWHGVLEKVKFMK